MKLISLFVAASALSLWACEEKGDAPAVTAVAPATAPAAAASPTAQQVHKVACGCEFGGACANLIEVKGAYVPLTGELGLGPMAFCGKQGLEAEVEGKLEGEKFVATSFRLLAPAK